MYIDTATVAKLVRRALKEAYPKQKFSVRTSRYSMGASVDVSYTDGPLASEVRSLVSVFEGKRFDGRTDSSEYVRHIYEGEEVHFSADSVSVSRTISDPALEVAKAEVQKALASNDDEAKRVLWDRLSIRHPATDVTYAAHRLAQLTSSVASKGSALVTSILLANPWLVTERTD